jgi:hypothetical protein
MSRLVCNKERASNKFGGMSRAESKAAVQLRRSSQLTYPLCLQFCLQQLQSGALARPVVALEDNKESPS